MKKMNMLVTICSIILFQTTSFAECNEIEETKKTEECKKTEETKKTVFQFWSRMTLGKVVSSTLETSAIYDIPFAGEWLETVDGGIKITRQLTPFLTGRLNFGVVVNAATVTPDGLPYEHSAKKVTPALLDATLEYKRGGLISSNDTLTFEAGYFPFKYNAQSTNLGEYLFRSGTYPGWLISGFENSIDKPKLAGVHLSYVFGNNFRLKQDLIVNTELEAFPLHDINLTYIATPSIGNIVDLGLGVQFARFIPVDPRKTTLGNDPLYRNKYDPKIGYLDPVTNDTVRYTFTGTKLMARASFDFKQLFGGIPAFFGKEDLKIYGEAAFLGVKNYKGWYEDPKERVPSMLGINWFTNQFLSYGIIPGVMGYFLEPVESNKISKAGILGGVGVVTGVGTWLLEHFLKINTKLDVISFEIERYKTPYANCLDNIWKTSSPVPYLTGRPSPAFPRYDRDWNDSLVQKDDDIRWSVYMSKKLGKYLRLSGQVACDHTPKIWYSPWPAPQSAKFVDMVPKSKDWYFMTRLSIYF